MITSIVLKDTYKIGMDSYNKFMLEDNKVSIKEVPFVRYRFNNYSNKEIEYIKKTKNTFIYSCHLAEITLDDSMEKNLREIDTVEDIAKFIYIDVNDSEVLNGFTSEKLQLIETIDSNKFDRIMLRDKSTKLDTVSSNIIKKQIGKLLGIDYSKIGICSSPLSFGGKNACLTASKAREIASKYTHRDDIALPSANHECMNCCGCIRYFVVGHDLAAPVGKTTKKASSKTQAKQKGSEEKKAKKKSSKAIAKWI